MPEVVKLSLENDMDLVLAHKRTMKVAEKLGLTIATQTTFATAVSEIARTVIEHTDNGVLTIGLEQNKQRYALTAAVAFDSDVKFTKADEGFYYAQKLVPEFTLVENDGLNLVEMKIGIPRSLRLDPTKIRALKEFFDNEGPLNAYDEIKQRNVSLNRIAEEQEEELRRSKIIDEKKTEFISIASHEIKTPITIIKAYSQIVKASKDQCSDRVKEMLEKIDAQSTKLLSIVTQLLDISKIENGNLQYNMQKLELNQFILDMLAVMKYLIPNHNVVANLKDEIFVVADRLRLEQVFTNLLGNAAKYSKVSTTITIDCMATDDLVTVSVTDEGIGMSVKSAESIFNKFYRDKDVIQTHSGLGMGLYIASKIVTDHKGKIWVDSEEGIGSAFHFSLPVLNVESEVYALN